MQSVSRLIAGYPGERLVGVNTASRITLEASHQSPAIGLAWTTHQHPAFGPHLRPVAIHAPASSSCKVTLYWLCSKSYQTGMYYVAAPSFGLRVGAPVNCATAARAIKMARA